MKLAQKTERFALAGALLGMPVAIVLEQVWVAIAPILIAMAIGSHERKRLERTYRDMLMQQEQMVERFEQAVAVQSAELRGLLKTVEYRLVYDRPQSRQIFLDALREAEESIILVSPWLSTNSINVEVLELLNQRLANGIHVNIGFCTTKHLTLPVKPNEQFLYSAVEPLKKLRARYPDHLRIKAVGTHEKYLVCDRKYAMLGSHNFMTSGVAKSERELGIWTCDRNIIFELIDRYKSTPGNG